MLPAPRAAWADYCYGFRERAVRDCSAYAVNSKAYTCHRSGTVAVHSGSWKWCVVPVFATAGIKVQTCKTGLEARLRRDQYTVWPRMKARAARVYGLGDLTQLKSLTRKCRLLGSVACGKPQALPRRSGWSLREGGELLQTLHHMLPQALQGLWGAAGTGQSGLPRELQAL
ncbi:hypothetical protein NDU88_002662 [Pleurodeles waltl]|uniref:Uncharacterized protein n=1 Tax=Pleurodeles waltl TaxID=8319 RepID=A0AAV7Q7T0_PLEWA|nr:hypothetical protein NDU88_002662 [Pleurodeles waltl]